MGSVGMDLGRWVQAGLLRFRCVRPSLLGLEAHLSATQALVEEFDPTVVVMDPISDLVGTGRDVSAMLTRQVDFLKGRSVTAMFTSLAAEGQETPADQIVASLIDTCLLVRSSDGNGELDRVLSVLKSRGMAHSNQVREFLLTDRGIELADVYVGPQGVLTGSARSAQEARGRADAVERQEDLQQRRAILQRQRESVEAQVAGLCERSRTRPIASPDCSAAGPAAGRRGLNSAWNRGDYAAATPVEPDADPERIDQSRDSR